MNYEGDQVIDGHIFSTTYFQGHCGGLCHNHDFPMREAGQRVQLNLSRYNMDISTGEQARTHTHTHTLTHTATTPCP